MTSKRSNACEVAVIGAGPYGLSVAAHLKHDGISTHVFGEPMSFWRDHMPKGMRLRSPWRATHLSSPEGTLSLDAYAAARGTKRDRPLPVEEFIAYGNWFQEHAVPEVDCRFVRRVETASNGFQLHLADGETFSANRVVIATGLANHDYRPPALRDLPAAFVSHTSDHADLAPFRGKHVAVIGRGQSACESAALLAEAGAQVDIVSRGEIHWLGALSSETIAYRSPLSTLRELLAAPSAVGPFPQAWLVEAPAFVRHLPFALRERLNRRCLKAGAAGWLEPRLKNVHYNPGRTIAAAHALSDRIVLEFEDGQETFDHILMGTGYRPDVSRVEILSAPLLNKLACIAGSPLLSAEFESSVPGLHFVGCYAVNSFGALMRFIAGAPFAARSVAKAARTKTARSVGSEFSKPVARWPDNAAANMSPPR